MKLFANNASITEEIETMERDENPRREDRATVSAFFNGQPPYSQEEAEALGLQVNVNNLFGYTDLASAKDQLTSLFTKPPRLWSVELDYAPASQKKRWEFIITRALNRAVKRSGKMRIPYEGVAGDASMHGEGEFFFASPYDPFPDHLPLSKRLVPSGASADPAELSHFAIATEIPIRRLAMYAKNGCEGWNTGNIRKILSSVRDKQKDSTQWGSRVFQSFDNLNPEEVEYARQERADVDRTWRTHISVYYFFQTDDSQDPSPLSLTILARGMGEKDAGGKSKDLVLFEQKDCYPHVSDAIHPFFMDCILGGAPKWHRVKGPGHLNYSLAWNIEVLMCRLLQGAGESSMNFWQIADDANRETVERIIMKHNGVIPQGVSLAQQRSSFDFNGVLAVLNVVRQAANRNNRTAYSNTGDQNSDELQVQAMFRQGQINQQVSSRMANWYNSFDGLGDKILSRFTSTSIDRTDRYYSEVMEFQSELERHGVPLHYAQPWNVKVTSYRITGDGDEMKARAAAQFFMQNMAMYPPESQNLLKQICTAVIADDYELAEKLVPLEAKPDADQVRVAESENNTALTQGRAPMIAASDVDEVHLQVHLAGLAGILKEHAALNQQSFTPKGLLSFKMLGGHAVAHIQRMEQMGKKDPAKQLMEAMNALSKMAEKLVHNMQQQQEAQPQEGEQVDPVEAAKLELSRAQLALAEQKLHFAQAKFERTQATREQQGAIDTSLKLQNDARQEEKHRADMAARDVELALEVNRDSRDARKPATAKA